MRARKPVVRTLPEDQREHLRDLLAAIPAGVDETHPAFEALLGWWREMRSAVPWWPRSWTHTHIAFGGDWVLDRPEKILAGFERLARCIDWGTDPTSSKVRHEPPIFEAVPTDCYDLARPIHGKVRGMLACDPRHVLHMDRLSAVEKEQTDAARGEHREDQR